MPKKSVSKKCSNGHCKKNNCTKELTFGQRAADVVTYYCGSWYFIISLFIIMAIWMFANVYVIVFRPWDPYPFILLNFVLSCLAAIQAPIILMSQNRQAEKDRARAEYDYSVNRKAEREIKEILTDLITIKKKVTHKKRK